MWVVFFCSPEMHEAKENEKKTDVLCDIVRRHCGRNLAAYTQQQLSTTSRIIAVQLIYQVHRPIQSAANWLIYPAAKNTCMYRAEHYTIRRVRVRVHARICPEGTLVLRTRVLQPPSACARLFSIHFPTIVITIVSNRIACSGAEVIRSPMPPLTIVLLRLPPNPRHRWKMSGGHITHVM